MITIGNTNIQFRATMETIRVYDKGKLKPFVVPTTWAVATRFSKTGLFLDRKMCRTYCSPNEFYSQTRGEKISLARLLKSLKVKRETRLKVWDAYFALEV